ncbi:MAG: T9SS type A sorting domain-containing protein [Bacteroidales bacterium]
MMKLGNQFRLLTLFISISHFFCPAINAQTLKAVNDTIDLIPEIGKTFDLMANDTIPLGDSIQIYVNTGTLSIANTHNYKGFYTFFTNTWGFYGTFTGSYMVRDFTINKNSNATIFFRIHDHSYDSLDINNVKAAITAYGNQFLLPASGISIFKIPKNGMAGTMFNTTLWIGGKDSDSTLYLAAEEYKQGPFYAPPYFNSDFYAGPVMDSVQYSIYQDTLWAHTWKVTKSQIEYHKTHWNSQGYVTPPDILKWPGNGNTALGQAAVLAPFYDRNGDGIYNPSDGDYPSIMGDEAIFSIFNDDRNTHKETGGNKMKIEIHVMAYAFDLPEDSAFKNTIFLNYKIFNRSARTYYNTYMGTFADMDIGYYLDDNIGCDVGRGSIIGFNGTPVDGTGQSNAYGSHPPAQSVTILGGPFMDPAGYDRPRFDNKGHQLCNESINGTGFGDSIANNERYGLTNFLAYSDAFQSYPPTIATGYYQAMQSIWTDSTHLFYGGDGKSGSEGYGPDCRFMFPGLSDSLNWGPGCKLPNGPVDWTEGTSGFAPNDIRSNGGMGPFTFHPGDVQQVDVALVWARDYTGEDTINPSVTKLGQMIDIVRNSYNTGLLPNGGSFFGIDNHSSISDYTLKIYPNPANEIVNLLFNMQIYDLLNIQVLNTSGSEEYSTNLIPSGKTIQLDVSRLATGMYIIKASTKNFTATGKLIIIKD